MQFLAIKHSFMEEMKGAILLLLSAKGASYTSLGQ
jgi:hypothetical protein